MNKIQEQPQKYNSMQKPKAIKLKTHDKCNEQKEEGTMSEKRRQHHTQKKKTAMKYNHTQRWENKEVPTDE